MIRALLLALALLLPTAAPAQAAPTPAPYTVTTLNMHGGTDAKGGGNGGRIAPVRSDVLRVVRAQQPDALALQELCRGQFRALRVSLKRRGYVGTYTATNTRAKCVTGVALFVKAPRLAWRDSYPLPRGDNAATARGNHPRRLLCASAPNGPRVCAVHLTPGDPDRTRQLQRVGELARALDLDVLAGDFNAAAPALDGYPYRAGDGIDHVLTRTPADLVATTPVKNSDHPAVTVAVG